MFNFVKQAWVAITVTALTFIAAIIFSIVLLDATSDANATPSGNIVVEAIVRLEHRINMLDSQLDRLQRVTLTEFRSQGVLWVDRLFPVFEEVE